MAKRLLGGQVLFASSSVVGLLGLMLTACGGDPGADGGTGGATGSTTTGTMSTTGTGGGGGGGGPLIPFACPGGTVGPDMNTLTVGGVSRIFYADFPTDMSKPMGVLFSWHGYGQATPQFRTDAALDPNGDPSLPVVVITPDDTGVPPPTGLDWNISQGMPTDMNVDIAFFEAILGCLNEQLNIDPERIYSFGFSAGSVMTNLLHSRYPKLLSAIVTVSGAWFNDQAEKDLVNVFTVNWNWPPLDPADSGTVLLTHGGPTDVTVANILDLEASAQAAFPFLKAANRVVVDCGHMGGHTLNPEVTPAVVSKFISAHRAGEASPYVSGGFSGFPASCTLRLP